MKTFFDLFDHKSLRQIWLEEGGCQSGKTMGSIGENRCRNLVLTLPDCEEWLAQGTAKQFDVIQLSRCQLSQPRSKSRGISLIIKNGLDQRGEVFTSLTDASHHIR
ncbi:MAG TPA: hypothetical protein VMH81_19295 [Bryobacteraceae bacterium]|nr:hypothetical protein [Bryobacteraceae bacterium]